MCDLRFQWAVRVMLVMYRRISLLLMSSIAGRIGYNCQDSALLYMCARIYHYLQYSRHYMSTDNYSCLCLRRNTTHSQARSCTQDRSSPQHTDRWPRRSPSPMSGCKTHCSSRIRQSPRRRMCRPHLTAQHNHMRARNNYCKFASHILSAIRKPSVTRSRRGI